MVLACNGGGSHGHSPRQIAKVRVGLTPQSELQASNGGGVSGGCERTECGAPHSVRPRELGLKLKANQSSLAP